MQVNIVLQRSYSPIPNFVTTTNPNYQQNNQYNNQTSLYKMSSPFALLQNDEDFLEQVERENRSEYVLSKIKIGRKISCSKSLEHKIDHTDSMILLKQKKHHVNNIGLLHLSKGPKNPKTIAKIKGLSNVRFFHEGNIYYPGD